MPKFSLPQLNFDIKKAVMVVVGAGVLGLGGWLAWDAFMTEPPPPPPPQAAAKPKPKPPVEVPPEKLVEELLNVSGVRKSFDQIPGKVLQGAQQSSARPRDPAVVAEVEKIMQEAFSSERFHKRVQGTLIKDFDRKRVETLIAAFRAPLVKKMVELEGANVEPQAVAEFARGLTKNPLPKERIDLVQRLDAVTRASEITTEIVVTTTRAMVAGATGGDAGQLAVFDKQFGAQRGKLAEVLRNAVLSTFAYIYRDVSDADLAEYLKFYEGEDGKWLMERITAGMIDEFRSAGEQAGERIAAMAKLKAPKTAASSAKPAATATPVSTSSSARPLSARARQDARECLKQETNQAIHRCAEGFR